ncbi:hypothetical protein IVIADoCa7_16 [Xanthomonas phage vB_Xar_IVIA-DoCa7]|uniref:Uncharacterized protein n=1 Tax=Xanthomonas phage vB_Xar_IVIA-DoCa7 TaxID=2975534 RepID=A0A9X9NYX4_9CAUD|nr:hypothetical protein IVIADoCa7_16 [Xanthomonas phage vB_Xar_IVIA-DoCa7]
MAGCNRVVTLIKTATVLDLTTGQEYTVPWHPKCITMIGWVCMCETQPDRYLVTYTEQEYTHEQLQAES